ncbi:MAG: hypothetical protein GY899_09115 [Verrucomicrobiaceae bacterium]|nr:hypothetical protein [Verrucomicrobiaceae bacterium]
MSEQNDIDGDKIVIALPKSGCVPLVNEPTGHNSGEVVPEDWEPVLAD